MASSRKGRPGYPAPSTVAGCVIRELHGVRGHPHGRARDSRARGAFLVDSNAGSVEYADGQA